MLRQRVFNDSAQRVPLRRCLGHMMRFHPFIVSLPALFRMLDHGIAVLNADHIVQAAQREGGTEKIPKLPVTIQVHSADDDMIMNVMAIRVRRHDVSVISMGETLSKLLAQPVGFPRGDLTGQESLPHVVGDHIILSTIAPGSVQVGFLHEHKLRVRQCGIAPVAYYQTFALGLFGVLYILNYAGNGRSRCTLFSHMEGNQIARCRKIFLPFKKSMKRTSYSRAMMIYGSESKDNFLIR